MEDMDREYKEILDYKRRISEIRHDTCQCLIVCLGATIIVTSVVWAICLYNLEAVKHPVNYNQEVNYERRN